MSAASGGEVRAACFSLARADLHNPSGSHGPAALPGSPGSPDQPSKPAPLPRLPHTVASGPWTSFAGRKPESAGSSLPVPGAQAPAESGAGVTRPQEPRLSPSWKRREDQMCPVAGMTAAVSPVWAQRVRAGRGGGLGAPHLLSAPPLQHGKGEKEVPVLVPLRGGSTGLSRPVVPGSAQELQLRVAPASHCQCHRPCRPVFDTRPFSGSAPTQPQPGGQGPPGRSHPGSILDVATLHSVATGRAASPQSQLTS